ncbi:RRQRL motif-containing zinc-binding protein [Streptacidiphilus neutrinimicus]|uniref:RRQRL motif-containing zinc-binding protein n=1 Tax=Streptacidiphilus neutrinimicus TaxID=105420 RepID=UPI000AAC905F|nr:RRQRL motif-containing zinc-binding protein [Streptacidiphilus neutrinimicus]
MRAIDDAPDEEQHDGIPTWRRKLGPDKTEMATRRDLRAMGLRPGGQPVCGQLVWRSKLSRGEEVFAYLYRVDLAKPVRPMTPAKQAALDRAMAARRTCPRCKVQKEACISKKLGCCVDCATPDELFASAGR